MSWVTIDKTDDHLWELNEETQQFRIDGQTSLQSGDDLAKMLSKLWGYKVTTKEATNLFRTFLAMRKPIPPGSGKTSL